MMIASTFWAMNERTALSCSSSLPWASANLRSIPSFFASSCISLENAGRQSPSSPTCEKPIVTANAELPAIIMDALIAAPISHCDSFIVPSHVHYANLDRRRRSRRPPPGLPVSASLTSNSHTIRLTSDSRQRLAARTTGYLRHRERSVAIQGSRPQLLTYREEPRVLGARRTLSATIS